MRYSGRAWSVARILFGLFFIYAPIMVMVRFGGRNPPEVETAASDFARALDRTGFMNPLVIATMLAGGTALLFRRSATVGLILLAPSVAVIAGFHWFLTGNYLWGSVWPIWFCLLAWHDRQVLSRLWN